MTLKQYIAKLNKLAQENPKALDMQVVASKDSEGNSFSEVYYHPIVGAFAADDFTPMVMFKEEGISADRANAVCIN